MSNDRNTGDALAKFSAVEEEGRDRASKRDSIPTGDDDFLRKLQDTSNQMARYFQDYRETEWQRFMQRVANVAYYDVTNAWKCEIAGKPRSECITPPTVKERMELMDDQAKRAFGKKCTWMLGDRTFDPPYHHSMFLNDLTACYHRGVEKYGAMAKQWHREGKCKWRE